MSLIVPDFIEDQPVHQGRLPSSFIPPQFVVDTKLENPLENRTAFFHRVCDILVNSENNENNNIDGLVC